MGDMSWATSKDNRPQRKENAKSVLATVPDRSLQLNMDAVHTCETCKIKYACGELVPSFIEGFIELRAIQKCLW